MSTLFDICILCRFRFNFWNLRGIMRLIFLIHIEKRQQSDQNDSVNEC